MRSAQIAPGSSCGATQAESRNMQKPILLPVGAMKQAHPSRKHMQAGVGRVKNGQGVWPSALTVELVLHGERVSIGTSYLQEGISHSYGRMRRVGCGSGEAVHALA